MRFAFTDALHLRSMHAVDLVLAVALLHEQLPTGYQKFLQCLACNQSFCLSFDVTDHAPKVRPELLHRLPGTFELPGVSVTGLLVQYLFANPDVGLPELDTLGFRQVDESLPGTTE